MVVALDEVFHVIALGKIRADATFRVGGRTLAAFAHPQVYAVADMNRRSGKIPAGNIERILRLHVATLSWNHVMRLVHIRWRTHEHTKQQDLLRHDLVRLSIGHKLVKPPDLQRLALIRCERLQRRLATLASAQTRS